MEYNTNEFVLRFVKENFSDASQELLRLAKNEIYARHGYIFRDPALKEYFLTRDWYTPCYQAEEFDESCFNEYEKANLELLVSLGA
ncbi:YARHG domain-containing protein [Hominifimenecus sp. rT4P-3]|uniref:YARHG domain-containing protein n=1 Tax=Hominifimenecus sp. rT4P-3 TaxID=3242979 RepID=UPI003DA41243